MFDEPEWDPVDLAASWVSPPGLGRCLSIGSAIGVVVALIVIAVPCLLSGMEVGSALGFGAFVAFWGGLGFGSMMGGVAYVMGLENATAAGASDGERSDAEAAQYPDRLPLTESKRGDRHVA